MRFSRVEAKWILAGTKTQHRIPKKPTESRCPHQPTKTRPVVIRAVQRPEKRQGRTVWPGIAHIRILETDQTTLGEITYTQARAEGHKTTDDFKEHWETQHPKLTDSTTPLWVLRFELAEIPRFLAHRNARMDYTTDPHFALEGEPEAVDDSALQWITKNAEERFKAFRGDEHARREARARAAKIKEAELRARKRGLDVAQELAMIDAALESMLGKGEAA